MRKQNSSLRNSIDINAERPLIESLLNDRNCQFLNRQPVRQSLHTALRVNIGEENLDGEAIKKSQHILKSIINPILALNRKQHYHENYTPKRQLVAYKHKYVPV